MTKHKIYEPLEDFFYILDQPHDGQRLKSNELEEDDKCMYKSVISSFLFIPKSCVSSIFIVGFVRLDIHLICYVANHIIFPRKVNFNHLTRSNVTVVWLLANKIKTNWATLVIQPILGSKRNGICFPCGELVANILEHVGYNFEGEVFVKNITKII